MTSKRVECIADAVCVSFPEFDREAALLTIACATSASDVSLAALDKHLTEYPNALVSGASNSPPAVVRLVRLLQAKGVAAVAPRCGKCGREKSLPYRRGGERWCGTCYSHVSEGTCIVCGKTKKIGARTKEGPICPNCQRYRRSEPCDACGRTRPVAQRRDGRALCQACIERPQRTCSACGRDRSVHALVAGRPVCRECYRQPERRCGVCGTIAPISLAATDTTADVCVKCYTAPMARCSDCGSREPCEHDQEYYARPGNESLRDLDAQTLARRRRIAPRPDRTCARCLRQRPAQAVWPMGPVCSGCYDAVRRSPGRCPVCGQRSALIGLDGDEPTCGPCAGSSLAYLCRRCQVPARAVSDGLCARCHAQDLIDALLEDAHEAWSGLRDLPTTTESPHALVTWLKRSRGATILTELIAQGEPPAHDALPAGKAEHYLRSLLVEADILPARNEPLERLADWTETLLTDDDPETQNILRRFANWHVLRRARSRTTHRAFTESSGKWARQQVRVARDFLTWLREHDLTLDTCRQPHLDLWLASGNTRRYVVRDFIAWGRREKLVDHSIRVPVRSVRQPTAPTPEPERWGLLARLLKDDSVSDEVRVAGTLVLVYGQHLSRIVALQPSAVDLTRADACMITLAGTALPLPGTLGESISRLLAAPERGKSAVARRTAGQHWLFPGGNPGHHITAEHLRKQLAQHDISLREARHAALLEWARDTPGPVLAEALGLHINTAVAWRDAIQADFLEFVAARSNRSS